MNTLQDTISTLLPDARHMAESVLRVARMMFNDHHEVSPALFSFDEDGELKHLDTNKMMNDELKPTLWAAVRELRQHKPVVGFISEVWIAKCKPEDSNPDGTVEIMPRDHPDKQEKVMFQLWQGKRSVSIIAAITRNPDNLGEWEVLFDSDFPKGSLLGKKGVASLGGAMMEGSPYPLEAN